MFTGFNLPKNLLDASEGLLKQITEQDKKFNGLLSEYGVTTPMELSEQKQVEFLNRASEVVGTEYSGLRKLREAVNLREYEGYKTQHEKMVKDKMKARKAMKTEESDSLDEAYDVKKTRSDGNVHHYDVVEKNSGKKVGTAMRRPNHPDGDMVSFTGKKSMPLSQSISHETFSFSVNRAAKKHMNEEQTVSEATVAKKDYSWGKMLTVRDGTHQSFPLHPEHQSEIKKLKPGESHHYKDETGRHIEAKHHDDGNIHFKFSTSGKSERVAKVSRKELFEASNEAPNIQRLTLTQEEQIAESSHEYKKMTEGMSLKERTAFHMAAAAAAKAGQPHFMFGGKKFKASMSKDVAHKMTEEPVETMKQVKMVHQEGAVKRLKHGETLDTFKKKPAEEKPAKEKTVKEEALTEREMTSPEMNKREKIVKAMKKGLAGFKKRYGDRAKDVMYATATKQAMKEEQASPATWMYHHPEGEKKNVTFKMHPDADENSAKTRIMQINAHARAQGGYNPRGNTATSMHKVKVTRVNEESEVVKRKSKDKIDMEPKMDDGITGGAQVKSGSV